MRGAATLAGALLALACARPAAAQNEPPQLQPGTEEMYQQALQSIAEGRKNDASETLQRVIDKEPLHAGAWLDLALMQCALGHAAEAEKLFDAIEKRFAPPPGITSLIDDARAQGCDNWQPHSSGTITVGRGIDQNVNQGSSSSAYTVNQQGIEVDLPLLPDFLPRHDQYSLASFDYSRDLTPNGTYGFLQLQSRHNDSLHDYDTNSLFLGAEAPWRFGRWTLRVSSMLGLITLGGKDYQHQVQLQAQVGPPLPLPEHTQFIFSTGVTRASYMTLSNFDSATYDVHGDLSYRGGNSYVSATLGFQSDMAIGQRPGGDRHGSLAAVQWRHGLGDKWNGELAYTRQEWRGSSDYSPGLIDQVRLQTTHTVRAAVVYSINKSNSLQLELRQIHNKENISIFQYSDRQLQLNWQWQAW